MKKTFVMLTILSTFVMILLPIGRVFGQTTTPDDEEVETIERIKDLVASKVAELDLVERRGILGTVKSTSNTQITLMDNKDKQRAIDIDELTEFVDGDEEDFGISDINEGDSLAVVGLFNKDNERLLARFVTVINSVPLNIDGKLLNIDDDEFTISIGDIEGNIWTVDIETSTDTFIYEGGELTDSGFSQLEIDQRIIAIGFEDDNVENRFSASRIIHFASIPADDDIKISFSEDDEKSELETNE